MTNQTRNQQAFALLNAPLEAAYQLAHRVRQLPAMIQSQYRPLMATFIVDGGLTDMAEVVGGELATNYHKAINTIEQVSEIYQKQYEKLRLEVVAATDSFIKLYEPDLGDREISVHADLIGTRINVIVREITDPIYDERDDSLHARAMFLLPSGKGCMGTLIVSSAGVWTLNMEPHYLSYNPDLRTIYHEDPLNLLALQYGRVALKYTSEPPSYHLPHDPRPHQQTPEAAADHSAATKGNQRRELTNYKKALAEDVPSPSALASLSGKLRKLTLRVHPDRVPMDVLVNDLREELTAAQALLTELTQA